MSNSEVILELLDDVFPDAYCDDCLSIDLGIQPRQQVNHLCHILEVNGKAIRQRGVCSSCKKPKTTNVLNQSGILLSGQISKNAQESKISKKTVIKTASSKEIDIEIARSEIVKICQRIWEKNSQDSPPHSISSLINLFKNDDLVPVHLANMMLVLCNLRNVYVYENIKIGPRENEIALNALSIVQEWWNNQKK
ncbi:MAG: hypothetical protein WCK35_22895 [Chloroflexota bacterium]